LSTPNIASVNPSDSALNSAFIVLIIKDSIFVKDIGFVFLVGIFSIGLHWKAPEFAAAITGGMASGAGSIAYH
jgi:hypothetical protein